MSAAACSEWFTVLFDLHSYASVSPVAAAIVYVMAKEPVPGLVKTRLVPPLSAEQAADCHRAFVTDTLTNVVAASHGLATVRLAVAADGAAPWLSDSAARHGLELRQQGRGDLGRRMRRLTAGGLDEGRATVLVGADAPDLPAAYVREAISALAGAAQLVLGPATDGGYYLIGVASPAVLSAGIFDLESAGVAWGGASVFSATVARADAAGVRTARLPEWSDVDDVDDLTALALRLDSSPGKAPNTRSLLAKLGWAGPQPALRGGG